MAGRICETARLGSDILLQVRKELTHPPGSLINVLFGYRVRDANVLRGAECFAGHGDHVSFVQQAGGQLRGGLDAAFANEPRDIRDKRRTRPPA